MIGDHLPTEVRDHAMISTDEMLAPKPANPQSHQTRKTRKPTNPQSRHTRKQNDSDTIKISTLRMDSAAVPIAHRRTNNATECISSLLSEFFVCR